MATPMIKQESDASGPNIKQEPADSSFRPVKNELTSDDEYEDAGDLNFDLGKRGVWLVKLPKFLMENWEKIEDDEEITLGHVWVKNGSESKLKCILSDEVEVNKGLPRDYDMSVTNMSVTNTFIFSEKDMPGYEQKNTHAPGMPEIPYRLLQGDRGGRADREKQKWNKNQRREPYYRKPIPKITALVGTVKHEAALLPVHTAAYRKLMEERTQASLKPKSTIQFLDDIINPNLHAPGTVGANAAAGSTFASFIKHSKLHRKPQEMKAARMPRNELLDALFGCFREYTAWSIRGLRERLNQPESYLKEVLNEIAILHKSGKFSLKYTLKPEYTQKSAEELSAATASDVPAGTAPEVIDIEDDEDDDDDDDVELEDVL